MPNTIISPHANIRKSAKEATKTKGAAERGTRRPTASLPDDGYEFTTVLPDGTEIGEEAMRDPHVLSALGLWPEYRARFLPVPAEVIERVRGAVTEQSQGAVRAEGGIERI